MSFVQARVWGHARPETPLQLIAKPLVLDTTRTSGHDHFVLQSLALVDNQKRHNPIARENIHAVFDRAARGGDGCLGR